MPKLLLVDDDPQALESMRKILVFANHNVTVAEDGRAALELARAQDFDAVVTDIRMPKMTGLEFLKALSVLSRNTPVILMTAFGRVEDAVWAMKLGAVDFLTKPFKRKDLLQALETAVKRSIRATTSDAREMLVGSSPGILKVRELIRQIAKTEATVLIQGESGTGKEIVARIIHKNGPRASHPWIAVNCAAIPDALIEAELFGYEKGAFTGAHQSKKGLLEAADQGTIFLDEIGDMPLAAQTKLLRVLQEKEVRPLGSHVDRAIDVRVLAASNQNLRELVRASRFREDLLFRLDVIGIEVPALRQRREDLPVLVGQLLDEASRKHGKTLCGITDEAMEALIAHSWPGNVRELSNVIERGVLFADGDQMTLLDLPAHLISQIHSGQSLDDRSISIPIGTPLKEIESLMIQKTLHATGGDKNMAAKLLGVNSRTIYRKLEKGLPSESSPVTDGNASATSENEADPS